MSRDDIVMRPGLGLPEHAPARAQAQLRRRQRDLTRERGIIGRLARARAARRFAMLRSVGGLSSRAGRLLGAGRAVGAAGRLGSSARLLASPAAILFGVFAVAVVAAGRLIANKPFEGIGAEVNAMILGDIDDEARATMAVRNSLESDPHLTRFVGQQGAITSQIRRVAADLKQIAFQEQKGTTKFAEDYPVNNWLDAIILRAVQVFKGEWEGKGTRAVEKLQDSYAQRMFNTPGAVHAAWYH